MSNKWNQTHIQNISLTLKFWEWFLGKKKKKGICPVIEGCISNFKVNRWGMSVKRVSHILKLSL